jgi:hypothetical protein
MTLDPSRKRHLTFAQAASHLQFTIEDLNYFVIEGELAPSTFITDKPLRTYVMLPGEHYDETGQVVPEEITSTNEYDFGASQITYQRGFFHLVLGRQISSADCDFQFISNKPSGLDLGDILYKLETPIRLAEAQNSCVLMATELERFKATMSRSIKGTPDDKQLATKERNTLLKLVIGMAMRGYGHDPESSKSDAPKNIADDLASLGIGLEPDTVRKYLKQAKNTVLAGKQPQ